MLINIQPQSPWSLVVQILICSYCNIIAVGATAPTKNPRVCRRLSSSCYYVTYNRSKLKPEHLWVASHVALWEACAISNMNTSLILFSPHFVSILVPPFSFSSIHHIFAKSFNACIQTYWKTMLQKYVQCASQNLR